MLTDNEATALIDDALDRLGKARLSVDMAADLLTRSKSELLTASDKIAAAAVELKLAKEVRRGVR
jgi:hypothetical protein